MKSFARIEKNMTITTIPGGGGGGVLSFFKNAVGLYNCNEHPRMFFVSSYI